MTMQRCVFRFISGKYESAEFPIVDPLTRIGSATDLDMVLHDDAVSPRHANVTIDEHGIWLEDLGSASGTFVNGSRIGKVALQPGDRIIIGAHAIELRAG